VSGQLHFQEKNPWYPLDRRLDDDDDDDKFFHALLFSSTMENDVTL
jgi:hypothetical protein